MEEKYTLSKLFLRTFVTEILKNIEISPLPEQSKEKKLIQHSKTKEYTYKPRTLEIVPRTKAPRPLTESRPQKTQTSAMKASLKPTQDLNVLPRPEKGIPYARPAQGYPDLKKLNAIIADPRVNSIECLGPNKNILVRKDGNIQKTKLALTLQEINTIIKDFSAQTRIPLIGGTFKAALGNLIMTAITSDFVGSRFIIQKKNPFQPII